MNDTTVTVDAAVARTLKNAVDIDAKATGEAHRTHLREAKRHAAERADGFGEAEVAAEYLTSLTAFADRGRYPDPERHKKQAAVTEATEALVEAGVWER